jgi:phage terminase large subunit-like protein
MQESKIIKYDIVEAEYYKRLLFYKPNKKQILFHKAGLEAQERLVTGGNRSGKTYGGLIETVAHLSGIYNDDWVGYKYNRPLNVWIAGKDSKLVGQSLQKALLGNPEQNLKGILHPSLIKNEKKATSGEMYRTFNVPYISGGSSEVTFKTYEQGRKAFEASKIDLILLDEEPPFDIYKECQMRTMKTSLTDDFRGMIITCSTPLQGYSEFFNYFMDDRHPETVKNSAWYTHIEWDDAEHLPFEEKKRLLASMSPHEIEARTKGIPWPGSGLVYPVPESMLLCEPFPIPDHWARVYGWDFGWLHPACLFGAHDRDNDTLYLYSEYSVPERTPESHANALYDSGINWMPGVYDPAGKASQQEHGKNLVKLYTDAGFLNLTKADNSKEEGILKTLQRMQAGKLKIFSTLVKTRSELRKYARNEDGIPNKKDDHLMDCMRYIVMTGLSVAIPKNFMSQQYEGMYHNEEPGYY